MKKFLVVLFAVLVVMSMSTRSDALTLTIDDGAGGLAPLIINGANGLVTSNVAYGSYIVSVTTGLSSPITSNQPGAPVLHLNSVSVSGGAGMLHLILSDTYNALNSQITGFNTLFGGVADGTVSLISKLDATTLAQINPMGPGAFSTEVVSMTLPTNPQSYTLSLEAIINHGGGINTSSFDAEIAPVPEPGTILLLGAGLVGVAAFYRRKRS